MPACQRNSTLRRAAKQMRSTITAMEALAVAYVNRGTDHSGREMTRTEYRTSLTDEANLLRQQLQNILTLVILE